MGRLGKALDWLFGGCPKALWVLGVLRETALYYTLSRNAAVLRTIVLFGDRSIVLLYDLLNSSAQ